jgi:hypothetical protein
MISKVKTWFKNYGTEVLVIISIIFLLMYALLRISKKGTYTPLSYFNYLRDSPKGIGDFQKKRNIVSKSEVKSRQILENYFGKNFNKSRPDFLRNPVTGNNFNLELDCYNPELGLALEYNGIQHYKFTPFFHKNKEAFLNQKYRDDMKRRICKENRITLVEIPYTVKYEYLEPYIKEQLRKCGF